MGAAQGETPTNEAAATLTLRNKVGVWLGLLLFAAIWFGPELDPQRPAVSDMMAVAVLMATWWVTEVVPIGITAITIGVVQSLFLIRPARDAFTDYMDPSVWFIFGSLMIGMVFTRTGLTRRMAYKMLGLVGERTSMIYLGCFVMTSALTLIMAHTAVAATLYPLLVAVYALYTDESGPTRFGKGLFMGMAFVAGAGSIITLLGAARGAVAIGFYAETTGRTIGFFELSYYMLPVGVLMTFLLWGFFMLWYPPEKKTIPGLRERNRSLDVLTVERIVLTDASGVARGEWRVDEEGSSALVQTEERVNRFPDFVRWMVRRLKC